MSGHKVLLALHRSDCTIGNNDDNWTTIRELIANPGGIYMIVRYITFNYSNLVTFANLMAYSTQCNNEMSLQKMYSMCDHNQVVKWRNQCIKTNAFFDDSEFPYDDEDPDALDFDMPVFVLEYRCPDKKDNEYEPTRKKPFRSKNSRSVTSIYNISLEEHYDHKKLLVCLENEGTGKRFRVVVKDVIRVIMSSDVMCSFQDQDHVDHLKEAVHNSLGINVSCMADINGEGSDVIIKLGEYLYIQQMFKVYNRPPLDSYCLDHNINDAHVLEEHRNGIIGSFRRQHGLNLDNVTLKYKGDTGIRARAISLLFPNATH